MNCKTLLSVLLLFAAVTTVSAQWNVIQETDRSMSFGARPAFRLEFAGTDAGMVEEQWKAYAKTTFAAKLKKDKKSGEWSATGLKTDMMGPDPFAIYSTIEKTSNGSALNVWYDMGSSFLNRSTNAKRADEVSRSLRVFYYDVRRATVNKEIVDQETKQKDLDKKQKSLQKEVDNLRKDIENYQARIKKAEADIAKNEKDQEANLADQDAQRRIIEESKQRLNNVENEKN